MALCLILIHVLKFALDGVGYEQLEVAGDIFDILSRVRKTSSRKYQALLNCDVKFKLRNITVFFNSLSFLNNILKFIYSQHSQNIDL